MTQPRRFTSIIATSALLSIMLVSPASAQASAALTCLAAEGARVVNIPDEWSYQVTVINKCVDQPIVTEAGVPTVEYDFDDGTGRVPEVLYSHGAFPYPQYGAGQLVDYPYLLGRTGVYKPSITLRLSSDPTQSVTIPLPPYSINEAEWFDDDELAIVSSGTVKTCVKVDDRPRKCVKGRQWSYEECWNNVTGMVVQKLVNGSWSTMETPSRVKDSGDCSGAYPWRVRFSRFEPTNGSFSYRLWAPENSLWYAGKRSINVWVRKVN